jgi:hypothetical protein
MHVDRLKIFKTQLKHPKKRLLQRLTLPQVVQLLLQVLLELLLLPQVRLLLPLPLLLDPLLLLLPRLAKLLLLPQQQVRKLQLLKMLVLLL